MTKDFSYKPDPHFLSLGDGFADPVETPAWPKSIIRFKNDIWAKRIGLAHLRDAEWVAHFADFKALPDNLPRPLAQRYHGHQFRHYNPNIGDGRGFLFAQMRDDTNRLLDLGTKGSGTTPYSREGDGRLTLKGGVREILATEMLEALGVNTSKSFSLIETGEQLYRDDEPSPTRSAVLVRLNHGHIRIGTFQRHAYFEDKERLIKLADYCLETYFNEAIEGSEEDRILAFLKYVAEKTATLAAQTMAAGFVHGVLNSDNINITGESFDYGPWRFLPKFDPTFTAAYFDSIGLYAYGRQPDAIHWNVYQLAGCFTDIVSEDKLKQALKDFPELYTKALRQCLMHKLGIKSKDDHCDDALLKALNDYMVESDLAYETLFFDWYGGVISENRAMLGENANHYLSEKFVAFREALKHYEPRDANAINHPYFQQSQPCTMLIDEVETIWDAIDKQDDWGPLYKKIEDIRAMATALKTENSP